MKEWEAFRESLTDENGRWERLHALMQKLRMVLENPKMRSSGESDILEQVEARLNEAAQLFPDPVWLDLDQENPAGAERWFANHMGETLGTILRALELLQEGTKNED